MDYCCEVWGLRFISHTNQLMKLQKRAARTILKVNILTPSEQLFRNLEWLSYPQRVMYFRCIFIFKTLNKLSSDFFNDNFKFVSEKHNVNTRSATNLQLDIPKCNTEYYKCSFIISSISMFNSLPLHLKTLTTLSSLKKELKSHIMSGKC